MYIFYSPWLQWFPGRFSLCVAPPAASQNTPADWAEHPALSSYPQTPSYAAEWWPVTAHRIWPSPTAADETMRLSYDLCTWGVRQPTVKAKKLLIRTRGPVRCKCLSFAHLSGVKISKLSLMSNSKMATVRVNPDAHQ